MEPGLRAIAIAACVCAGLFVGLASGKAHAQGKAPSAQELAGQAEQVASQLRNAEDTLRLVETQ